MASQTGVSGGGVGGDESDSSSGIEQGDEPPHARRPLSQCSDGSNATSGSGDTEGPEEGFTSDHAQVINMYIILYGISEDLMTMSLIDCCQNFGGTC
jgi:hypothetical protein